LSHGLNARKNHQRGSAELNRLQEKECTEASIQFEDINDEDGESTRR